MFVSKNLIQNAFKITAMLDQLKIQKYDDNIQNVSAREKQVFDWGMIFKKLALCNEFLAGNNTPANEPSSDQEVARKKF